MVKGVTIATILFLLSLNFNFFDGDYVKETYMVEMRDGVKLATDVYLPGDGSGSYPVVLIRTPYNKNSTSEELVKAFVSRGYALVVQDLRGTHASEGIFRAFLDDGWNECQDGNDTVQWILSQEWCNGKIAVWGGSAMGIAGYMLAGSCNVTCMLIAIAASNMYKHAVYPGGEFRIDAEEWLKGQDAEYMVRIFEEHYNYDDFWKQLDLSTRYNHVGTPIYHIGGWYDIFAEGTMDTFLGLQNKGNQKLLMGPWAHGEFLTTQQGDLIYPINSLLDVYGETTGWLDYWMKGEETGIMDEKIRFYMMGECSTKHGYKAKSGTGNEWWVCNEWPPFIAEPKKLYLHENGLLSHDMPYAEEPDSFLYDPSDPVPTVGGRNLVLPAGPMRQNEIEEREDVLVYTTPPLEKPVTIAGEVIAHLWISSSAKDTDFSVRLCDVYPDGNSYIITHGILMARHRISLEREDFLEGEIYELNISLGNTAIVFDKGHRIRIDITSSNYPAFERNPNTGDAFRKNESYVVAENTIYHDAEHPSYILLPVLNEFKIEPENGIFIAGRKILNAKMLVIIGKINFEVKANCSKAIFYLDGQKKYEDSNKPFIWQFDEFAIGFHKIKVEIYNNDGKMVGREKEIIIFNI
ncbi:MAG: hypothetical protein DRN29_05285 [Thermoplasmata archaeon]|nr:MAG: hypothetical protein DRN29_05285 [Thermoplasmata archaeon]